MPTVKEAGFPQLEMTFWMGLLAPAGTPAPIVKRLETEMQKAAKLPDVRKQLENRLVNPSGMGSQAFAKEIADEIRQWDAVRKAANIPQVD
jgi:tripartite-type tricarboxylate transporter receptor subunit TctC